MKTLKDMPDENWYDMVYSTVDDDDVAPIVLHTSLSSLSALREELERIERLDINEAQSVKVSNVSEDFGLPFTHVKLYQNISDYEEGQDGVWSHMPFVIFCLVACFVVLCALYGFTAMISDIFF